ncbi:serine hydrolase, partial [Bacteroides heparinolyticus]
APASVYGHTGFTGTCAWADPENNLVYVFLCNRIYPNVWNNKLMQLNIRTRIQEAMYKAMLPRASEEGSVQQL